MFNEYDYPKFTEELCINDEVYVIDLDQCGVIINIRIDTNGEPIITVKYKFDDGYEFYDFYVARYCDLRDIRCK